jgi:hypothetical protein
MAPVTASWALWSKRPGTNSDYSVLACSSGPFSRADFAAILQRFTPGNPSVNRRGPGELPWVTLSWVGIGDGLHLGIAIQDRTEHVDGAGRPVTQTAYFCVPYTQLAQGRVTYTGLYAALPLVGTLPDGGAPVSLNVSSSDPDEQAEAIHKIGGEELVAAAAGLLLGGPVSVVQAEESSLAERLGFLDSVAAMLPYGYRAKYTAGTWTDSGSRHRIRLAFAERPRADAVPVVWRASPVVPSSTAARGYLAQLNRLRGRAPGQVVLELPQIIEYLAADTTPRKFDEPQHAIASLRSIDLPYAVLAAVREGAADPAEVRMLFGTSRISELAEDAGRRTVLAELIGYASEQDVETVRSWWGRIVGADSVALLSNLLDTCRKLAWASSPARGVWNYLELADEHGFADELLAELIVPPAGSSGRAAGYVGQLVNGWVMPPDRNGRHPKTLAALSRSPLAACELMAQLSGPESGAAPQIAWLVKALGPALTPFLQLLTAVPPSISPKAIAALAVYGPDCIAALLRGADRAGRLTSVLPGFTVWLLAGPGPTPAEAAAWARQLDELTASSPQDRACADLALLAIGAEAAGLFDAAASPSWGQYADRFVSVWFQVRKAAGDPDLGRLALALCDHLDAYEWPEDPVAVEVVGLIARITAGGREQVLTATVVSSLVAAGPAGAWPEARDWLADAFQQSPIIGKQGAYWALQRLAAGATAQKIARGCQRAYNNRVKAVDAGRALAASDALASPAGATPTDADGAAVAILRTVRDILAAQGNGGRPALLRGVTVVSGAFGATAPSSGFGRGVRRMLGFGRNDPGAPRDDRPDPLGVPRWFEDVADSARRALAREREPAPLPATTTPGPRTGSGPRRWDTGS